MTSQHHWFSGSQLDVSKFSNVNNFLVYSPIWIKFAPKSLVLEIGSFCLWFYCFRSPSFKTNMTKTGTWPKLVGYKYTFYPTIFVILFFFYGLSMFFTPFEPGHQEGKIKPDTPKEKHLTTYSQNMWPKARFETKWWEVEQFRVQETFRWSLTDWLTSLHFTTQATFFH